MLFGFGPHNSHNGLRTFAQTQFRLIEQLIDDVVIALNTVVDDLGTSIAAQHKEGRGCGNAKFRWELNKGLYPIVKSP